MDLTKHSPRAQALADARILVEAESERSAASTPNRNWVNENLDTKKERVFQALMMAPNNISVSWKPALASIEMIATAAKGKKKDSKHFKAMDAHQANAKRSTEEALSLVISVLGHLTPILSMKLNEDPSIKFIRQILASANDLDSLTMHIHPIIDGIEFEATTSRVPLDFNQGPGRILTYLYTLRYSIAALPEMPLLNLQEETTGSAAAAEASQVAYPAPSAPSKADVLNGPPPPYSAVTGAAALHKNTTGASSASSSSDRRPDSPAGTGVGKFP
jgi:hypothetical protein